MPPLAVTLETDCRGGATWSVVLFAVESKLYATFGPPLAVILPLLIKLAIEVT